MSSPITCLHLIHRPYGWSDSPNTKAVENREHIWNGKSADKASDKHSSHLSSLSVSPLTWPCFPCKVLWNFMVSYSQYLTQSQTKTIMLSPNFEFEAATFTFPTHPSSTSKEDILPPSTC